MHYETACYMPGKKTILYNTIRKQLPEYIKNELIRHPDNPYYPDGLYVEVETYKTDVIAYLDKLFYINDSYDFLKRIDLEVDKSEMPNFTHFEIFPNPLEWGREVFSNIVRPTCDTESCPVGARMLSPVRISPKKAKRIDIAEIGRPWGHERELMVAPWVRKIFESEGITGLEYEPCVLDDGKWFSEPPGPIPFVARVIPKTYHSADDILVGKYYCEKHTIPMYFWLINEKISSGVLTDHDFQTIDRVIVKGKTYYYYQPGLIITRRVLELLLKHKVRGLLERAFFLKEKFLPVILDQSTPVGFIREYQKKDEPKLANSTT